MVRRVKIDILVDIMSIYIIGYHAYFYMSVTPLSFHYTVFYYFFVKFVQWFIVPAVEYVLPGC